MTGCEIAGAFFRGAALAALAIAAYEFTNWAFA